MAGYSPWDDQYSVAGIRRSRPRRRLGLNPRLHIGLAMAGVAVMSYCSSIAVNPVTGKKQFVAMTVPQEIALGLQSAPELAAQHGGVSRDQRARAHVEQVGRRLLERSGLDTPYEFNFHLLADPQTVNAFALPGGQVFITEALYRRLETDGQLAGVLGHEIGHVLERHAAEHLATAQLTQGLTGAAVLATYDPNNPSTRNTAAVAALIGQLVNLNYGRNDELESDRWGVELSAKGGYDPRAMMRVMEILREAGGGGRQPEFMSSHPDPGNRIERIESLIRQKFPQGVPSGLEP
jgi:predicted Zn-dependent protease